MDQLVLIVDDDPHIREVVRFALQTAGFRTVEASGGDEALTRAREVQPDLIILDIRMPQPDGIEVCKAIRRTSTTPIVFLSSMDEETDRILGLELGGDDYVTKPFSPRELVARVKAVLRRAAANRVPEKERQSRSGVIQHGLLTLDLDRFRVLWDGQEVILTLTEFGIVRTLLGFPGKVFTRDELMSGAYSFDNIVTDRTIDSHVRRVRKKFARFGGDPVETVHGVGYRLGQCTPRDAL